MKKILVLLLIALSFSGCEKDDICDANTPTTPRLIIDFYDASNPTELKNVINLKVIGFEMPDDEPLGTFTGVSQVQLPLKTTLDSTKYRLILNSTSTSGSLNEDVLQFDYTRKDVFVSRACGYKTIYKLNAPNGVTKTDASTPDGFWIQQINIETTNIETENETHIKMYIL